MLLLLLRHWYCTNEEISNWFLISLIHLQCNEIVDCLLAPA